MAKVIRETIALATVSEAKSVLLVDAQSVASDSAKYLKANLLAYYILVNTWLLMFKEHTSFAWIQVKNRIMKNGLRDTIAYFADCSEKIVLGEELSSDFALGKQVYREVQLNAGRLTMVSDPSKPIGQDPKATVLQLFRYPKRFSPLWADKLQDQCLNDFISGQNRIKLLQRRSHPYYLVSRVRTIISDLFPWQEINERIRNLDITDIQLTNGAGLDASSSTGSKLCALANVVPDYFISWVRPAFLASEYSICEDIISGTKIAEVRAVPKSYKAARIIAMEETYRQALAKRVFSILSQYLPTMIDIRDQTRNQIMAREGSITGNLATLDLKAASDSIQVNTIIELFPYEFTRLIDPVRPTHYRINGKDRLLHSYMTMGNALTFILETIVFYAISYAAVELCNGRIEDISVYGDDIIVPSHCAQTCIEFLETFGFQVNSSKSFVEGPYRESCGEEYWHGLPVSSYYYPRFAVEGEVGSAIKLSPRVVRDSFTESWTDTTTRLLDLQHRLMLASPSAGLFLAEIIREAHPRMTQSLVSSTSHEPDIWDFDELRTDAAKSPKVRQLSDGTYEVSAGSMRFHYANENDMKAVWNVPLLADRHGTLHERHVHLVYGPSVSYQCPKEPTKYQQDLYQTYLYNRFLKYGPQYDDSLLELLGVSAANPDIRKVFGKPVVTWKLRVD